MCVTAEQSETAGAWRVVSSPPEPSEGAGSYAPYVECVGVCGLGMHLKWSVLECVG